MSKVNFQTQRNAENHFWSYLHHCWRYIDATNAILLSESSPFNGLQPCFFLVSHSFGAMPRLILAKMSNWDCKSANSQHWYTVKGKVLVTYWVIISSPKQFDLHRWKVKVINTTHWVLKVRSYLKTELSTSTNIVCIHLFMYPYQMKLYKLEWMEIRRHEQFVNV